jgi:phosphate transport system ATP-binding protein
MRLLKDVAVNHTKMTIRNLDFWYSNNQALKNVSLDLPEKQVTGLIGPSGCGKSMLLPIRNRLYDLYPKQRLSGEVLLDGEDILGPNVDVRRLRGPSGMVFQEPTTFPMSVYANVAFGMKMHEHLPRADQDERVEQSLTRAGLWNEVKVSRSTIIDGIAAPLFDGLPTSASHDPYRRREAEV